jgi:hypothetical protein
MNRFLVPAIFLAFVVASCCFLANPAMNLSWFYREHLRYGTLSQEQVSPFFFDFTSTPRIPVCTQANAEQINWLVHAWHAESDEFDTSFKVDGWVVCEGCMRGLYGIPASTWFRRKEEVRRGTRVWHHASTRHESRLTAKGYASRVWMADYFYTLGDFQPDTGQVHLPPCDKNDIFDEMHTDLGELAVKLAQFYHVWDTEYSDVRVPSQQRLGKCETCDTFHQQIISERDQGERDKLKLERVKHMKNVKADRLVYHTWRKVAREQPDKYIVISLDGMDQSKTNLPRFANGDAPTYVTARIIGALVQGAVKRAYAYLVTDFSKETNTMVEVLRRTLDDQDRLPPTLILQLDNTCQENKNSHLFAFLGELVETKIFKEVIINFLPVGTF